MFDFVSARKLAEVLQITNHCTDLKEGSSLDYFVAGFWWTKEQNFNQEQASALFTIIHILLDNIKGIQKTAHPRTGEGTPNMVVCGMLRPPTPGRALPIW